MTGWKPVPRVLRQRLFFMRFTRPLKPLAAGGLLYHTPAPFSNGKRAALGTDAYQRNRGTSILLVFLHRKQQPKNGLVLGHS